ncbi:hypothetical protein ACFPIJ_57850 [Dactylosporangium cerinum]|uniref:Uncharacterized protein n=1 Tax=Dactylosporangium cerinum TaxID=1434730 RepID=A0ABV9WJL8_9ACTN
MQPRRHRMRQRSRRDSARAWITSGAAVSVKAYAKRYGVDRYTAFDDLAALGVPLPAFAQQWAQRPPSSPRLRSTRRVGYGIVPDDDSWIVVDGRSFFVVGYTAGGAPYGFTDETSSDEDWI